jgi:plastocyanin
MNQPNTFNFKLGDTVEWTNDDSAPHTVTDKNESICNNDESNAGTVGKILDEFITNIVVNIRNNLRGGRDGGAK